MKKRRQADEGWGGPAVDVAPAKPTAAQVMAHQWESYPRRHSSRMGLAIHAAAVPIFWAGAAYLAWSLCSVDLRAMGVGAAGIGASLALQGIGHSREEEPGEPYSGVGDAVSRVLIEQFVSFPRYVASGGLLKAWKAR